MVPVEGHSPKNHTSLITNLHLSISACMLQARLFLMSCKGIWNLVRRTWKPQGLHCIDSATLPAVAFGMSWLIWKPKKGSREVTGCGRFHLVLDSSVTVQSGDRCAEYGHLLEIHGLIALIGILQRLSNPGEAEAEGDGAALSKLTNGINAAFVSTFPA